MPTVDSLRRPGGACVAIFRPGSVGTPVREANTPHFDWNLANGWYRHPGGRDTKRKNCCMGELDAMVVEKLVKPARPAMVEFALSVSTRQSIGVWSQYCIGGDR